MTIPQYGHAGRHHGIGTPECPTDLHHHHDEQCKKATSPRADRMQAAFTAAARDGGNPADTIIKAVETATRVRRSDLPRLCEAYRSVLRRTMNDPLALRAVLEAAGFEVIDD